MARRLRTINLPHLLAYHLYPLASSITRPFVFAQDRRPKTGDRNTVIARARSARGNLLLISIISRGIKIPTWGWPFDFPPGDQDRLRDPHRLSRIST